MKLLFTQLRRTALTGLALAASLGVSQAATTLTGNYTNNFDIGTNTANFAGSGSVAGWIYWYGGNPNLAGGNYNNTPMTNEVDQDYQGNPNSGSLQVVAYLAGYNQAVFFAGFDNGGGYDDSEVANLLLYSNVTFYIKVAAGTVPRVNNGTNIDFGTIGVGFSPPGSVGWAYTELGRPAIPLAASNAWAKISVPINYTLPNVNNAAAIAFDINSYNNNYPLFTMTNFIDDLQVNLNPGPPPPPPTLGPLTKPVPGLNQTSSAAGGQYSRNEVMSASSTGLGFADKADVTYSWTITSFPANNGQSIGTGIFIVGGSPGLYDQAADYNLAQAIVTSVQQQDDTNGGGGVFQFRYKTNQPGGNGMVYNTFTYNQPTTNFVTNGIVVTTNVTINNTNNWPVEPIGSVTNPGPNGALGTWQLHFHNQTNITVITPSGLVSSNFTIDPASVTLFADPATVILYTQPNTTSLYGKGAVIGDFSITGNDTPFNDNFLTDTALNTTYWRPIMTSTTSDSNSVILVPATSAYWLPVTLPDVGFSIRTSATLGASAVWSQPTLPVVRHDGHDYFLVDSANLPSATSAYFQAIQYQASQLQVLLGGQTNAPGTLTGYTGTATNISFTQDNGIVNVTINAVDPTFHIVPGISDSLSVTCSDPIAQLPTSPALANSTLTTAVIIQSGAGTYTVSASDTSGSLAPGMSTTVTVTP